MDFPSFPQFSKRKINLNLLLWIIFIFFLFSINQCNSKNKLEKDIVNIRKELKNDYEQQIKKREVIIDTLKKDNQVKKKEIKRITDRIDSLDRTKIKIEIKYVNRIKQIKNMDSENIKNYWYEEFR